MSRDFSMSRDFHVSENVFELMFFIDGNSCPVRFNTIPVFLLVPFLFFAKVAGKEGEVHG